VAIILGQFLSLLLCGTGVTSQLLETNFNIAVPTSQAFLNYALLAAVFGVTLATRSDFLTVLWKNWWKYAILGAIDVEANFLVILAYKYTNLTSVQVRICIVLQYPVVKIFEHREWMNIYSCARPDNT
jgi:solute carrier family 35 protein F1/2